MNNLDVTALIVKHYHFKGHSIRALIQHHQTWFYANDICSLLGYSDPKEAVSHLNQSDLLKLNFWDTQKRMPLLIHDIWGRHTDLNQYFIDEFGLSALLINSKSNNTNPFRSWLVHNLMPDMIPTLSRQDNDRYRHHKLMLIQFGWRMIQSTKKRVNYEK